ncbi:2-hydroxyacid dehydrogenase [Actinoallomurus rhizosphaericola]|uniref:2-hydroxyacid dehydrogenase n=1 Tax=Actinoallomurus rhizosphaericola TaxID=2952536 RepID=UPI002092D469|nr:2-hydroxyacid dehydrogenase [Actinoallomurus rhizosphaericola]MCO5994812.1 2-hydroxyacid dehydrogenase [Actinoallomurus rhizosphaericola]
MGGWPGSLTVGIYDGTGPAPADLSEVRFYVLPYAKGPGTLDLLSGMPKLEAVQSLSAGVDTLLPHVPPGVTVCNGRGLHDASVAEHVLGLILAAQRELPRWVREQDEECWRPHFTRSLAGSRVLLLGYGSIAAAVEARLLPFEVEVRRVARRARPAESVHGVGELPDLLPHADIVVSTLPLTAETTGLLDGRLLAALPDDALVVNVGRGGTIDTAALLAETGSGRLRAALDVTDPEPPPPGHPLWSAPNILITPHVAGGSATFYPRAERLIAEQLRRFAAGEPLLNQVTRPA